MRLTKVWWPVSLTLLLAAMSIGPAISMNAEGATIQPGVRLTFGNTSVILMSSITFSTLNVRSDRVIINGVEFSAIPSIGNLSIEMLAWDPHARKGTVLEWVADYSAGGSVNFSITGLPFGGYVLRVDGIKRADLEASGGAISFTWSEWSRRTFALEPAELIGIIIPLAALGIAFLIVVSIIAAVAPGDGLWRRIMIYAVLFISLLMGVIIIGRA